MYFQRLRSHDSIAQNRLDTDLLKKISYKVYTNMSLNHWYNMGVMGWMCLDDFIDRKVCQHNENVTLSEKERFRWMLMGG